MKIIRPMLLHGERRDKLRLLRLRISIGPGKQGTFWQSGRNAGKEAVR